MTIDVKSSIAAHINNAFAEQGFKGIAFVNRLINSELALYAEAAETVLTRSFDNVHHETAYAAILSYTLDKYSLTETIALLGNMNLEGDDDIIDHNLRLLASEVMMHDNTWKFFKKEDLCAIVKRALDEDLKSADDSNTLTHPHVA